MKWMVVSSVLSALSYWVPSACADVVPEAAKNQVRVVVAGEGACGDVKKADTFTAYVTTGSPGDEGDQLVWVTDDAEGDGIAGTFTLTTDDESTDGKSVAKVVRIGGGGEGAWLGISMGSVPEAVDAQTGLNGEGVMILNVVEGSPADDAGLASHDIILSIDGQSADGDIHKLVKAVGDRMPGDPVEIVLLRDGTEQVLTATLGSRKGVKSFDWKFDVAPMAELDENIKVRGKMLRKGDDGEWWIADLGEIEKLAGDLPHSVRMMLPKSGNRTMQFSIDGDHQSIRTVIKKDDTTLAIAQENGGDIVVTRTDAAGVVTVTTYADADELQAADEEAYTAFEHSRHVHVTDMDVDGLHDLGDDDFDFDFDFDFNLDDVDVESMREGMADWHQHISEAMGEAGEEYREAMEKLHEALAGMKDEAGNALVLPELPEFPIHAFAFRGEDESGHQVVTRITAGKARQSFQLTPEGRIEVRLRKGDSELLQVFESEADLEARDPSLYNKYRELIDSQD